LLYLAEAATLNIACAPIIFMYEDGMEKKLINTNYVIDMLG